MVPELYVRQNPIPNAYCMAIKGKRPFIVVHTVLLDLLTPAEVRHAVAPLSLPSPLVMSDVPH